MRIIIIYNRQANVNNLRVLNTVAARGLSTDEINQFPVTMKTALSVREYVAPSS